MQEQLERLETAGREMQIKELERLKR